MRSWFRTCANSCRGRGGSMHAKTYLFSKTGAQPKVVMSSSANLTGSAATNQYNDMYTVSGAKRAYRGAIKVFNEAARDRPAAPRSSTRTARSAAGSSPAPGRATSS